jgi:hypothetical protein
MPTSLPAWIRIKRLGDEVVGLASPDGQRWNEIARAMFPLGEGAVHVGVAASGAEPGPETPFVVPEVVVCDLATWGPAFGTEGSSFRRGDCNDDGTVDISDAVFSLGSLFLGDGDPDCDDACDSNGDGEMDISDAINTLGVLFLGQGSIPPPGMTDCGVDPTAEQPGNELGCLQYESCPEG